MSRQDLIGVGGLYSPWRGPGLPPWDKSRPAGSRRVSRVYARHGTAKQLPRKDSSIPIAFKVESLADLA